MQFAPNLLQDRPRRKNKIQVANNQEESKVVDSNPKQDPCLSQSLNLQRGLKS